MWQSAKPRRRFLIAAAAVVGLAGCLGHGTSDDEGDSAASDIPSEQATLIEDWIDAVAGTLEVRDWRVTDQFIPQYIGTGPEADVPILAESYAEIISKGFAYHAMPTAVDTDGMIEYMVLIDIEWAESYTAGDMARSEYERRILDSLH